MPNRWLLIETFDDRSAPSIIGIGSTPKKMVPLSSILSRGRSLNQVEAAVAEAAQAKRRTVIRGADGHHVIAEPLVAFTGHVHGVYTWVGSSGEEPPPRDLAGAWHFNLTTDTIGGSSDLLDLYGVLPEDRQTERATEKLSRPVDEKS